MAEDGPPGGPSVSPTKKAADSQQDPPNLVQGDDGESAAVKEAPPHRSDGEELQADTVEGGGEGNVVQSATEGGRSRAGEGKGGDGKAETANADVENDDDDLDYESPPEEDYGDLDTDDEADLDVFGCTTKELEERMHNKDWNVRRELLWFIREESVKKNPRVIRIVKKVAATDKNVNIRQLASEVLVHIDMQGVPEQIWLLRDVRWQVRRNALKTLGHIAEPTDPAVLAAVVPCLTDPSACVRESAIISLMDLALRAETALGSFPKAVLNGLLDCLQDMDSRVRTASAESIIRVALPGDQKVVVAVAERMLHEDGDVRRAASSTLVALAVKFGEVDFPDKRDPNPLASPLHHIKELMLHPSLQVQRAAIEGMEAISSAKNSLYNAVRFASRTEPLQGCAYVLTSSSWCDEASSRGCVKTP
jgi:HEAT repeat protein